MHSNGPFRFLLPLIILFQQNALQQWDNCWVYSTYKLNNSLGNALSLVMTHRCRIYRHLRHDRLGKPYTRYISVALSNMLPCLIIIKLFYKPLCDLCRYITARIRARAYYIPQRNHPGIISVHMED